MGRLGEMGEEGSDLELGELLLFEFGPFGLCFVDFGVIFGREVSDFCERV